MAKIGERVAGVWATFDRVKPFAYVDGYGVVKSIAVAVGELGAKGDSGSPTPSDSGSAVQSRRW